MQGLGHDAPKGDKNVAILLQVLCDQHTKQSILIILFFYSMLGILIEERVTFLHKLG